MRQHTVQLDKTLEAVEALEEEDLVDPWRLGMPAE